MVINLCLLFYYNNSDEFDPELCGRNFVISNNDKTMLYQGFYWQTCYGKKVISSTMNGIYIWKLKIISTKIATTVIGIDDAEANWGNYKYFRSTSKAWYGYNVILGWIYKPPIDSPEVDIKKGFPIGARRQNSIITMKLIINDNQSILTFKNNDGEEFIACDHVKREDGLEYRLAISSSYKSCSFQILKS